MGAPRSPHRYAVTAMRMPEGSPHLTINSFERAKGSCAVQPRAVPAARPATPDAVNTLIKCWQVFRSASDAVARPPPDRSPADPCCRGCSGAEPACWPFAFSANGPEQPSIKTVCCSPSTWSPKCLRQILPQRRSDSVRMTAHPKMKPFSVNLPLPHRPRTRWTQAAGWLCRW